MNIINSIENFNEYKFKEKASQFIGQVYHIESEEEASEILLKVKKQFYDARHHCYAWRLNDKLFKYSDDGEPNGTAGIRILNAIDHYDLNKVLVISIRYFGGIKLGVGPLGKAYYNSAFGVLESAEKVTKVLYRKLIIKYDYEFSSKIHYLINQTKSIICNNSFSDKPIIEIQIKPELIEKLQTELIEFSSARIEIKIDDELFYL